MIDVPYRYAGPRDRYGSPPRRSTSRRAATWAAVICALAVSSVTPGFSLTIALVHHHVRVSSAWRPDSTAIAARSGSHTSIALRSAPVKPSGATPTIS